MKKNIPYLIIILILCFLIVFGAFKLSNKNEQLEIINENYESQSDEINKLAKQVKSLNDELEYLNSELEDSNRELRNFKTKELEVQERENNYLKYKTLSDLTVYQSKSETSNKLGTIPKNTILKFPKTILNLNNSQNRIIWWGINYDGLSGYIISEYWGLGENLQNGWRQNLLIVK